MNRSWLVSLLGYVPMALVSVGCAPRHRGRPEDAGGGGNGGGSAQDGKDGSGGGGGGGGGATSCSPGSRYCDGISVRECDPAGKPGPVVDTCSDACSAGRCTSADCAAAEAKQSVVGCLFYGLDTDNSNYDDKLVFGFPVGNPSTAPVNVTVKRATGFDTWMDVLKAKVPPGEIAYLRVAKGPIMGDDYHIEGTGQQYKGYRIESEGPVVAYDVNSDDEQGASYESGSTLLLPVHVIGRHYYAIAPPERGIPAMGGGFGGGDGYGPDHAFISIIGAQNSTKVDVKLAGSTSAGGGISSYGAGDTVSVVINEGEVLQLESDKVGSDLSGSEITSDKPVTVYAGNVCGGFDPARLTDCDHVEEEMYPVTTWGKSFAFIDLRIPQSQPSESIWGRIIASEDGTTVSFDAPRSLTGLPSTTTLDKGAVMQIEIKDPLPAFSMSTKRAHFFIDADKPVEVESFMGTQEGGAVVIPVDQFLDDYLVSAHPGFTGYMMVTRSLGTPVTLDGMPMADSLFTPAGGGYEISYVSMARCDTDLTKCGHRVSGAKIGVTMTANGGVCNYCYAGGAGARCVNKTAGCR